MGDCAISESEIGLCLRLTIRLSRRRRVRRLEVITGTGRRRRFSEDFKARIVEETLVPGAVVSEVARRHGLTPQQVFTWRRQARQAGGGTESRRRSSCRQLWRRRLPGAGLDGGASGRTRWTGSLGVIEVEIDGVTVRIGRGAEAKTVAAVIRALKAGA